MWSGPCWEQALVLFHLVVFLEGQKGFILQEASEATVPDCGKVSSVWHFGVRGWQLKGYGSRHWGWWGWRQGSAHRGSWSWATLKQAGVLPCPVLPAVLTLQMPWPVKPQPLYLQPSADFQPTGSKNFLSLDCEPGPGQGTKKMHKAQPCTGSQKRLCRMQKLGDG